MRGSYPRSFRGVIDSRRGGEGRALSACHLEIDGNKIKLQRKFLSGKE